MPLTTLLSPVNAPLHRLRLERLILTPADPLETLVVSDELVVYPLIGTVGVRTAGEDLGILGGARHQITEAPGDILHIPIMESAQTRLSIRLLGPHTADLLLLYATNSYVPFGRPPFIQHGGLQRHVVGQDSWQRTVWAYDTPPGCTMHVGETYNPPGHWSSYPAHGGSDQTNQAAGHEEVFFIVTPGEGLMRLQGTYCTGRSVDAVQIVRNGDALVTPLGSHPIVASPQAFLWYFWGYLSQALTKIYNRVATDVTPYVS